MAFDFDKIKNLFVVTEDMVEETKKNTDENQSGKKQKKVTERKKAPKSEVKKDTERIQTGKPPTSTTGEFNQKIYESLTKAIHNANLPGEDYLEFIDALDAMKNINIDDNVKMQTVLATLSTKGLTIETIIESAGYYQKVLQNEKDKFNEVLNSQTDGMINKKYKNIETLKQENEEKAQKIQELTRQINQNTEKINAITAEIDEAEGKIKKTSNDFNLTYSTIVNKIKQDVEKVKSIQNK